MLKRMFGFRKIKPEVVVKKPQFKIEQIAINPPNPDEAKALLHDMGFGEWVEDTVEAKGTVYGYKSENTANLSFSYNAFGGREFEVLNYIEGRNWLDDDFDHRQNTVTHLGMHCTFVELDYWIQFFADRGIGIAQEVYTVSHTNPFLVENGRKFRYVIFDTKAILGVDIKFIVRIEKKHSFGSPL